MGEFEFTLLERTSRNLDLPPRRPRLSTHGCVRKFYPGVDITTIGFVAIQVFPYHPKDGTKMKFYQKYNATDFRIGHQHCFAAFIWLMVLTQIWADDEPRAVSVAKLPAPIAHWKLDDDGRELRDCVGTHHGTIQGAVSRQGRIGKALLFGRSMGDHASIPHSPDFEISTFTVSAWVWLTKEPTFSGILGTRSGGEFNFDMKVNTDKVHGDVGDGVRWIDTKINFYKDDVGSNGQGGDLEIRRWYLITFVVDNEKKECRLYLDGDRKKTIAFRGEPRLMRLGQTMQIGSTGTGEFMDGLIDDVRIWKHALTDEHVQGLSSYK